MSTPRFPDEVLCIIFNQLNVHSEDDEGLVFSLPALLVSKVWYTIGRSVLWASVDVRKKSWRSTHRNRPLSFIEGFSCANSETISIIRSLKLLINESIIEPQALLPLTLPKLVSQCISLRKLSLSIDGIPNAQATWDLVRDVTDSLPTSLEEFEVKMLSTSVTPALTLGIVGYPWRINEAASRLRRLHLFLRCDVRWVFPQDWNLQYSFLEELSICFQPVFGRVAAREQGAPELAQNFFDLLVKAKNNMPVLKKGFIVVANEIRPGAAPYWVNRHDLLRSETIQFPLLLDKTSTWSIYPSHVRRLEHDNSEGHPEIHVYDLFGETITSDTLPNLLEGISRGIDQTLSYSNDKMES